MDESQQIFKTRDDNQPVVLRKAAEQVDTAKPFLLLENCKCSWLKTGTSIGTSELRTRIEPWLTALCQSEHLSLLLGSGLTHAVHHVATGKNDLPGMAKVDFGANNELIENEANRSAKLAIRAPGNFEDQIRAANELLRGLEIYSVGDSELERDANDLKMRLAQKISFFADSILQGEQEIVDAENGMRVDAFNYLVSFLMSFASRTGTRDRLNIFTTNYDRLIEAGAEAAGMHLLDRFVGSLSPVFRSSRLDLDLHYNPPGIRGEPRYLEGVARFTKLHGSMDWVSRDRDIIRLGVPFGARTLTPFLETVAVGEASGLQLMIYPNAAKDRETASYPYVELFRDFAASVCRPNHTLIAFGYSFGDEHINRVIEDMLTIPSTHLVIISYSDPLQRIMNTYERLGRHAQISLMIGNHIGDFQTLVDHYLPKPAIDRTTFRMAELLKSRFGTNQTNSEKDSEVQGDLEGGVA